MTTSPEQAPHEAALFRTIREWGITRGDHGVVGGVAEGVGDRIGMARVPARIILVVAAIPLTALVFLAYAAAWALLPDREGNIIVQNFGRGIPNVGALIGIALLTFVGLGSFNSRTGIVFNSGSWGRDIPWYDITNWSGGHNAILILAVLVPLVIIAGVITVIVLLVKRSGNGPTSAPGAVYAAPPAPTRIPTPSPAASSSTTADATATTAPNAFTGAPSAPAPAARQWVPVPPAPTAPPRRPRVPGPGRTFYLLTLAWIAIAAASAVWMERTDSLAVHPLIAGGVLFVTGLGVILIAVSLAGRKVGFLGFLAIASLLPLGIVAANADEIRTAYAEDGSIAFDDHYLYEFADSATLPPSTSPMFDPTLAFDRLYSDLLFNGDCYEGGFQDYGAGSVQRLSFAAPVADEAAGTQVDITAQVTYISIPRGTSITLDGDSNASATVVFADRGFQCDFWPGTQQYMQLANADSPTIDLIVRDDQYANTIVIQEVAP